MTERSLAFVADTATVPNAYVTPQTIVAIPPSDLDELGDMRVVINGIDVTEAYDPEMEQP